MLARRAVVIACVTFETVKVIEPAVTYKADEIHLFHYLRSEEEGTSIYREFYREVVEQLNAKLPDAKIVEHKDDAVYSFQLMFRDILAIVNGINKVDSRTEILINASAGTSEFSAAAIIASMMCRNVVAFTVGTKEYTVTDENKIRDIYFREGRPVGLTGSIREPKAIPSYEIKMPDEDLVRGLRLYNDLRTSKKSVIAQKVIEALDAAGLWNYKANEGFTRTSLKQKKIMYYQRHFINAWTDEGWVEKSSKRAKFDLTKSGKIIIDTFYVD